VCEAPPPPQEYAHPHRLGQLCVAALVLVFDARELCRKGEKKIVWRQRRRASACVAPTHAAMSCAPHTFGHGIALAGYFVELRLRLVQRRLRLHIRRHRRAAHAQRALKLHQQKGNGRKKNEASDDNVLSVESERRGAAWTVATASTWKWRSF
jgi:hypothetical protein